MFWVGSIWTYLLRCQLFTDISETLQQCCKFHGQSKDILCSSFTLWFVAFFFPFKKVDGIDLAKPKHFSAALENSKSTMVDLQDRALLGLRFFPNKLINMTFPMTQFAVYVHSAYMC